MLPEKDIHHPREAVETAAVLAVTLEGTVKHLMTVFPHLNGQDIQNLVVQSMGEYVTRIPGYVEMVRRWEAHDT